jgi:hypothetical protein
MEKQSNIKRNLVLGGLAGITILTSVAIARLYPQLLLSGENTDKINEKKENRKKNSINGNVETASSETNANQSSEEPDNNTPSPKRGDGRRENNSKSFTINGVVCRLDVPLPDPIAKKKIDGAFV